MDLSTLSDDELIRLYQEAKGTPPSGQDRAQAAASGFNKGALTYLPGLPVKAALDVADLVRAGYGAASGALGRPADTMPNLIDRESVVMSPEWLQTKMRGYGMGKTIDPNRTDDPASRILHAGGIAAGAAPVPGQMAKQVASGALAQGAQEVGFTPEWSTVIGLAPFSGSAMTPRQKAPTPERMLADKFGVRLTPGQETGSPAIKSLEGFLSQTPGSASVYDKIQQKQRTGFNIASSKAMGESESAFGQDASTIAKGNIGQRLNRAAQGKTVHFDNTLLNDLASVDNRYMRNLASDQRGIVNQYIDDLLGQGNIFSGEAYQTWRSRIGARAQSTTDSELKGALKGIQKALDSAFIRSQTPQGAAPMREARAEYRNWKTLNPLIEKASMSGGNIPPAQVAGRAAATENTGGVMGQLGTLGKVIGNEYPNSGTASRLFWQNLLTNPTAVFNPSMWAGATGVPYIAAKTLNSGPMQRLLSGENRFGPALTKEQELLRRYGGLLGYSESR